MGLFIDDGFTCTRNVDAAPGVHPAYKVEYRLAPGRKRTEYEFALMARDVERVEGIRDELIEGYVVTVDGRPLPKERVKSVKPDVRATLANLVLGYTPADDPADVGAEQKK